MDMLGHVKPERALFTTFTLSLNWFESYCLPILKAEGCDQIDLLVDSREDYKLGSETTSAYAGNAFRITSVFMNGAGIFHPKLAYLQSENVDTLVVGSGNLTPPGQGGSLEVIDAVNSDEHPLVFEEFAQFIDIFVKRPGLSEMTVSVLRQYSARARHVASLATSEQRAQARTVWLVHTLEETAERQFSKLVRDELPGPRQLTLYSPYHTASGKTVKALADGCEAKTVRVGLNRAWNPQTGSHSYFAPFDANAQQLPEGLTYVTPVIERDYSFSHAKCFEVTARRGCMVMTGSVNATWQSLCQTRNAEVSLVRKLDASPFAWKAAKATVFQPCEYDREHDATPPFSLQASWCDKVISGTLAPTHGAKTVRLEVISRSRMEFPLEDVSLDADGHFRVSTDENCDTTHALRLRLTGHGVDVTAWLNVEGELACPPYDRDLSRAATRAVNSQASPADLRRILSQFRRILRRERSAAETAPDNHAPFTTATRPFTTRYDAWKAGDQSRLGLSAHTAAQVLAAAFESLRQPQKASPIAAGDNVAMSGERDGAERRKGKRRPKTNADAWAEMLKTLPEVLAENASGIWMPALIAMSAGKMLKAALDASGAAGGSGDHVALTSLQWLTTYCSFSYSPENRERLVALFAAMGACALAFSGDADATIPRVKQNLERAAGRPLTDEEWLYTVDDALQTKAFQNLDAVDRERALEASLRLGEAPSQTERLCRLIAEGVDHDPVQVGRETDPYLPVQLRLRELRRHQQRTGRERHILGVIGPEVLAMTASTQCPACNMPLGDVTASHLGKYGAALHQPDCNKPIFSGLTRDMMLALQLPSFLYRYLKADA
jgi:hypothetical protein